MKTKELERIATPIGIEIAAESPEEIAISILAEVIAGDNIS
jgi:xanthine/CO dehydrogenase XdhC/CoxF family maturation factor